MTLDGSDSLERTRIRKPRKCPRCCHRPLGNTFFGFPSLDETLRRKCAEGRLIVMGCIISPDDPAWGCSVCGLMLWPDGTPCRRAETFGWVADE